MGNLRTHYCYLRRHRRSPDRESPDVARMAQRFPRAAAATDHAWASRPDSGANSRPAQTRGLEPFVHGRSWGTGSAGRSRAGGASASPRLAVNGGVSGGVVVRSAPQDRTSEVNRRIPLVVHWRPSPCNLIAVRPPCLLSARATADLHHVDQLPGTPSPPENTGNRPPK